MKVGRFFFLMLVIAISHQLQAMPPMPMYAYQYAAGRYASCDILTTTTYPITMECWVNWLGGTATNQAVIYNGNSGPGGYGIYIGETNKVAILLGGVIMQESNYILPTTNTWIHLALVSTSASSWTLYINGTSQAVITGSTCAAPDNSPDHAFFAGGNPFSIDSNKEYFNGIIDEIRFSNIARYTSDFTPPTAPLSTDANTLGLYHFDEGSGITAYNEVGGGLNLTLNSESGWTSTALPVELTAFAATTNGSTVNLAWTTATEVDNYGFDIERCQNRTWTKIGFVKGNGTSQSPKDYSFIDGHLQTGTYAYRLKQIDLNGSFEYSHSVEVEIAAPKEFGFSQNYPNPFNPSTIIQYDIPAASANEIVILKVFDVLGKELATLVNETKEAGSYQVQFNASHLSGGTYFFRLTAGKYSDVKKMILMR